MYANSGIRERVFNLRISAKLRTLWWFKNTFPRVHESVSLYPSLSSLLSLSPSLSLYVCVSLPFPPLFFSLTVCLSDPCHCLLYPLPLSSPLYLPLSLSPSPSLFSPSPPSLSPSLFPPLSPFLPLPLSLSLVGAG